MMIKAGAPVDMVLEQLSPLLDEGTSIALLSGDPGRSELIATEHLADVRGERVQVDEVGGRDAAAALTRPPTPPIADPAFCASLL